MKFLPAIFKRHAPVPVTVTEALPVKIEENTKALLAVAQTLAPLAQFFEGANVKEVMAAKAKSEFINQATQVALDKFNFDASRFSQAAIEVAHLVDMVYDKVSSREATKNERDPEIHDAEADFKRVLESVLGKRAS